MNLTDISNRLTPSTPIELTFGQQPTALGAKIATLIGHKKAGASGADYAVKTVINVGDSKAARAEVEAYAGTGAEIALMAEAFVACNQKVSSGARANFPGFRVVLLPSTVTDFGPSDAALSAINLLREDFVVSPYDASNATLRNKIQVFVGQLNGADRDLNGQFGSYGIVASLEDLTDALDLGVDIYFMAIPYLQDTNTADVSHTGDTVSGSPNLVNLDATDDIYPGAVISGTGVPSGTLVGAILSGTSVSMVNASGVPVNATASHSAESISFQNVQSQPAALVAAAHAAIIMQNQFPYNPMDGLEYGALIGPKIPADVIIRDPNGASEQLLRVGLAPLTVDNNGIVRLIRCRNARVSEAGDGAVPATSYLDVQDIQPLYDFREDMYNILQGPAYKNKKASKDQAKIVLDAMLALAFEFETDGAFQNVKALAPQFAVQISTTSQGRFDFFVPADVIPGNHVTAGNIQATTFTL